VSEADAADDPQTLPPFLRPILETTDASASVARRRPARLLATFLCLLFVVFGAVDLGGVLLVPGYAPPWYGYALLATAWLLNRSGRYTGAAALTLAMFPAVILGMVVSGASQHPASTLAYLAIGVQLAGILLPARGTALFAGATALAVLATPVLAPEVIPGLSTLIDPLALVAASSGLAVVSILHRDRLERDRQARLRDGEERLRLALEAAHMATWIWEARCAGRRGPRPRSAWPRARHPPRDRPTCASSTRTTARRSGAPSRRPWRVACASLSGIAWRTPTPESAGSRPTDASTAGPTAGCCEHGGRFST
jgi:hypothetical protein